MYKKHNKVPKLSQHDDDEIDFIEFFIKLWRWRWLITAVVMIITAATFLYVQFSPGPPITYTVKTSLKIGTVGTYHVQSPEMIITYVKTELFTMARKQDYKITENTPNKFPENIPKNSHLFYVIIINDNGISPINLNIIATKQTIDISIQTPSAQESAKWSRMIGDIIITNHRPLYANAVKQAQIELSEIKRMSVYVNDKYIQMKLMYENQKYPTAYILEPQNPTTPDPMPNKRILFKTIFSFFVSMFFGIIISLTIDCLYNLKLEMKNRMNKE